MDLTLDYKLSDDVIRMLETNSTILIHPRSISLGTAMELAFWGRHRGVKANPILQQWRNEHILLNLCWEGLVLGKVSPVSPFAVVDAECFCISASTDFAELSWGQFLSRFTSAMKRNGIQAGLANGISGAFHEMADNVQQHSCFAHPSQEMAGLAAYSVAAGNLSFVVGDVGVGALGSLKTNPNWSTLQSDREALHAIAQNRASRRIGQGEGQGYRDVFKSLASYNGLVRIRSNCGIFQLTGALDRCTPIGALGPLIPGFHLTIECYF